MQRTAHRGNPVFRGIVLLVLFGLTSFGQADETTTAMSLEDVVRLHVSGQSVESIVDRIQSSQVDFDLSEEMLEELEIAGVPHALIEAMIARQRELHPPTEPADDADIESEAAGPQPLSIHLLAVGGTKKKEDRPALRVLDSIGAEGRSQLQLGGDDSRITDLAIFVACTTPTHIPDHWRGESALGRDFISMPRHKLVAFRPGASREPAPGRAPAGAAVLALELPELLEVEIEPDESHDLLIGFAIRAEERYFRSVSAAREKFRPSEHGMTLDVEFRAPKSLNPTAVKIRFPSEQDRRAGQ